MTRVRTVVSAVLRRGCLGDEGGSSVLILMCVPVLVAAFGLVVDYGGRLELEDQVQWTADQASRSAGQCIQQATVQYGNVPTQLDVEAARAAALDVVSAAGMAGTVIVADGRIEVAVTARYDAKILPISGDVTGHSSARVAYGVGTEETSG